jgi:hypothetical protein
MDVIGTKSLKSFPPCYSLWIFLQTQNVHAITIVCRFRCASLPNSILTLPPVVFTLSTGTAYCHRPTLFNPGQALA